MSVMEAGAGEGETIGGIGVDGHRYICRLPFSSFSRCFWNMSSGLCPARRAGET